jgi:hypothetical protein
MPDVRIISDRDDSSLRPATRTINDALSKLIEGGELPAGSKLRLLARSAPGRPTYFSALSFRSSKGDDALFALPISRGCWAINTLGNREYLKLDRLDDAEVDGDGNVELRDGTFVHAVSLDVLALHFELPELEEIIVYLTIRCLKAEAQCFRNDYGYFNIDYSVLPQLRVPNVKELTSYVNKSIRAVPRRNGMPSFKKVDVATVHRTLDLVHIQKVQGRPKKDSPALTKFP